VLLLADVHPFLDQPLVARAIRAFVAAAPPGRRLMLVSPRFRIAPEVGHGRL
jgi:hypothetical protein